MLRFFPKLLLVATAFAPVMLTSAFVSWWKIKDEQKLGWWEALPVAWPSMWLLVASAALFVVVCIALMMLAGRKLSRDTVTIKSIKPADKELIGFVLAYLLPLARGTPFEGPPLFVVLLVFFVLVMTSNAYHTNPLLALLGWHFYEVVIDEVSYLLVSPRNIHNVRAIKEAVSLTDYMLLDVTQKLKKS
jgi:hypothetical protein